MWRLGTLKSYFINKQVIGIKLEQVNFNDHIFLVFYQY